MSARYENIDFRLFTDEPEKSLTKTEEKQLLKRFNQSVCDNQKKRNVRKFVAAAAVCIIVCLAVTPLGNTAWAAVKEVWQGIGAYLGMNSEDTYATQIGQTQTKGNVTVTLNEAVLSNIELRLSVTAEVKNGKAPYVDIVDTFIDGKEVGKNIVSGGIGSFGSKIEKNKRTCYLSVDAYQNVPKDPKIKLILACDDEWFEYEFTINNEKFKADTRTAEINKTIVYKGKEIKLTQLTVMPIAHTIQFENPSKQDLFNLVLHGTDNLGNVVNFHELNQANVYLGNRENEVGMTYELSHAVSSYTLRMYDLNNAAPDDLWNEKNAISDEFTVNLK